MGDAPLVTLEDIRASAAVLRGVAIRTPLVPFGPPADRRFLKAESLQPIGAFKIRGAYAMVASLPAAVRARGVITYSSGNHAQGVARAARLLGIPAVVVMPSDAPAIKRERVEADGAEVVVVGTASEERRIVAERLAAERSLTVIPPFDDDRIIAGQGTIGLELLEDLPDLAAVLVPVGGGGLASGIATAVKALRPSARVVGVEPELSADARDSLAAGEIVEWPAADVSRTIADGTRTQAIGVRTFAHLRAHLDAIVTVSEAEIAAGSASRPSSRGSSRSRPAPCRSRRWRSVRRRRAWRASTGRWWPWSAAATWTRSAISSTWRRRSRVGDRGPGPPSGGWRADGGPFVPSHTTPSRRPRTRGGTRPHRRHEIRLARRRWWSIERDRGRVRVYPSGVSQGFCTAYDPESCGRGQGEVAGP